MGILVFAVAVVLVLNLFHVSLRSTLEGPEAKENVSYIAQTGQSIWERYLKEPVNDFWQNYAKPAIGFLYSETAEIFWNALKDNIKGMMSGNGTGFENLAPMVPIGNFNNGSQGNTINAPQ